MAIHDFITLAYQLFLQFLNNRSQYVFLVNVKYTKYCLDTIKEKGNSLENHLNILPFISYIPTRFFCVFFENPAQFYITKKRR